MKAVARSQFGTYYVSLLTKKDISIQEAAAEYGRTTAALHLLLTKEPEEMNGKTLTKLADLVGMDYLELMDGYLAWRKEREAA